MQVSRKAARRLMMEKQLITDYPTNVDKGLVYDTVDTLGCLQIDTINVVERAHYLTLWSRLGQYDKEHLHSLAYEDRRLFEHFAHAACYIPFKDYRFYLRSMKVRREEMRAQFEKRSKADPALLDAVLKRVAEEGPLSSKDFEGPKQLGGWWNWKPAKTAMEYLMRAGILLVHHREKFQKYYDLAENVIPQGVDTTIPPDEERVRFFALRTLGALGLVKPPELRKYFFNWSVKLGWTSKQLQVLMDGLVAEGEVEQHSLEGEKNPYYCYPSDSIRLQELEEGDFGFDDVRLHIYFDNLLWNRERVEELFGFKSKLEVFLPQAERVYGYYHLPVLYGDRLVARLEPKMDRKNGVMIVRGYWVEEGFEPTEDYEEKLYRNLESFAEFHGAREIDWIAEGKLNKTLAG
jgi:uncharacterized protein YcaQ